MSSEAKQSTARLENLRAIEKKIEARWEEEKTFEVDAKNESDDQKRKFFVTFPFAYMKFD